MSGVYNGMLFNDASVATIKSPMRFNRIIKSIQELSIPEKDIRQIRESVLFSEPFMRSYADQKSIGIEFDDTFDKSIRIPQFKLPISDLDLSVFYPITLNDIVKRINQERVPITSITVSYMNSRFTHFNIKSLYKIETLTSLYIDGNINDNEDDDQDAIHIVMRANGWKDLKNTNIRVLGLEHIHVTDLRYLSSSHVSELKLIDCTVNDITQLEYLTLDKLYINMFTEMDDILLYIRDITEVHIIASLINMSNINQLYGSRVKKLYIENTHLDAMAIKVPPGISLVLTRVYVRDGVFGRAARPDDFTGSTGNIKII